MAAKAKHDLFGVIRLYPVNHTVKSEQFDLLCRDGQNDCHKLIRKCSAKYGINLPYVALALICVL